MRVFVHADEDVFHKIHQRDFHDFVVLPFVVLAGLGIFQIVPKAIHGFGLAQVVVIHFGRAFGEIVFAVLQGVNGAVLHHLLHKGFVAWVVFGVVGGEFWAHGGYFGARGARLARCENRAV